MEHRITSLLLPAPETELETSSKELDNKVTWLLHNNRKMDNYLELETFSKDERLCGYVCDTLRSLPETPTLAAYKDYKAIIVLLGISTTYYAILDELAEQHRKRNDIPELTAYCDALHWMRPGRQYLCNVYNTVCHAFHLLRRNPVRDNRLLITEQELRHAERMLPELGKQTFIEMVRMKGYKIYNAEELAEKCGMEYGSFRRKMKKVTGYTAKQWVIKERAKDVEHYLMNTSFTLTEVAFTTGFASTSNLNDFCRAYLLDTPGEIRRKAQETRKYTDIRM
ncbi:AraC family transcriptional regulator [Phocaeicola vulgatus]|uniref:helix-turn-helix domain-containing protein n=1 Tax=Phocaeicola vulgatus TaxID=821 RepID=UPI000E443F5C|nr:AraC family transcriptional regulator [Phocaeicola vulgatus]RGJ39797.1 AraC family transcriptional regulator [Phocaeicola vulgatus]